MGSPDCTDDVPEHTDMKPSNVLALLAGALGKAPLQKRARCGLTILVPCLVMRDGHRLEVVTPLSVSRAQVNNSESGTRPALPHDMRVCACRHPAVLGPNANLTGQQSRSKVTVLKQKNLNRKRRHVLEHTGAYPLVSVVGNRSIQSASNML